MGKVTIKNTLPSKFIQNGRREKDFTDKQKLKEFIMSNIFTRKVQGL